MDRRAPAPPAPRETAFCHQCENRWYRDEQHGLECPRCHSDFVEVLEDESDPRAVLDDFAPDPDEDDIEELHWQSHEADQVPHDQYRVRYERQRGEDDQQQQQGQGGWGGLLSGVLRLASDIIQPPDREPQARGEHEQQPQEYVTRQVSPNGTTTTRTGHMLGGNYTYTWTSSTSQTGLQSRNPHAPQPFQRHPQNVEDLMSQIFNNIGAFPHGAHPGFPGHPGFVMNPEMEHMHHATSPFPQLFQMLGLPMAGIHGDAVYSQEGLDRIISQLMEQHQTGNAPGPAPESAISSLPQREITKNDLGDSGTAECSICMESVELGEKVTVLPCEHWFHFDCIKAWLSEHDTCPHCRKGIVPEDGGDGSARQSDQPPRNNAHSMPGAFPGTRPGQSEGLSARMRDVFSSGSSRQ